MTTGRKQTGFSEQELLDGIRNNDSKVLKGFYAEQYPAVRNYVLRNSGSPSDAQDIFQDAITATWLNIKEERFELNTSGSIGAYVYRIAKNKWLDRLKSSQVKNVTRMISDVSDSVIDKEHNELMDERLSYLKEIYSSLDEKCRLILDKFYYEKKNLASISDDLGVDIGSIRTMKYRCMMKLRATHESLKIKLD